MIKLYSPPNQAELAIIESILEEENIPYFIHNNHFGSLEIGPLIDIYNKKTIMVEEAYEEQARELLQDFLAATATTPPYSIFDKIRMVFEVLFCFWFVPGRFRKRKKNEEKEIYRQTDQENS
jgi:hypothetical protein